MRALVGCLLCLLTAIGIAQPKLLLTLAHEPLSPDAFEGGVPAQVAWVVWERGQDEPLTLAMGLQVKPQQARRLALRIDSPANARYSRALLSVDEGRRSTDLFRSTLGARLAQAGLRGVYLSTPRSPTPTPYAAIVLSDRGSAHVKSYPSLEALRRDFFQIEADWAVLELKRWDYRALELLLAEGMEVWVVGIPSTQNLVFAQMRLSSVIRYAAREPRGLLTSPSTRWNGVIREVDITPSLYRALTSEVPDNCSGAPAFETRQSDWHRYWNGWLVRLALTEATATVGTEWRGNALQRSAEWAQASAHLTPLFRFALVALWVGWLGIGITLWRAQRLRGILKRVFVSGLAVFGLAPAAAILYAYYPFDYWTGDMTRDMASIGGWLTLGWAALSLVMAGLARWGSMPLLCSAAVVALGMLGADILLAGGYGVKRALFSAGISGSDCPFCVNQWFWGFGLAAAVLAPASWLESRGRLAFGARGQTALGMAYGLLLCLFGTPMLGAALDSWIPLTLAFGMAVGLFTGILRPPIAPRHAAALILGLLAAGGALTALAIILDALQPWQRQAGWVRDWLAALGWRFNPGAALMTLGVAAGIIYWLRDALGLIGRRAIVMHYALIACAAAAGVALLAGKTVASITILLVCALFALEYLIGGKDWGYAYEGNGVAH